MATVCLLEGSVTAAATAPMAQFLRAQAKGVLVVDFFTVDTVFLRRVLTTITTCTARTTP